ncbi:PPOX class F420-dependent oxidoreductase [Nocardioides donggukensis]|uniref:PPOX class F420-dependent oxidoreductase n=1 Tax=Nocardioides donggukensis TaxID=2774019 RepID=A0A927K3J2_9ACTN|nr:PPOX class F420-dependent oxidoreductase [Nocardioides donggukensis]MBD8869479.1 PPOX class F420-dependent oxidoreductase [Nocardioides donggukensis]
MDTTDAIAWARSRKHAVLVTIRADGRPQTSDVLYGLDGDTFLISVTDDRAKTANMRRDPRVVLHVSEPSSWSYLSLDGTVELTEVTTTPGDAASDALCAYYEATAGHPHPDWDEYRATMVAEGRLVARFTPRAAVGQTH